jgi:hypothetical protein
MGSIYARASTVISWLFESDQNRDGIPNKAWRSVALFFSNDYWQRVWVLQEMVLAQNLSIMIGRDILNYENVMYVVQLIDHLGSLPNPASSVLLYELWYYLSTPGRIDTTTHLLVEEFKGYAKRIDEMSDMEKLEEIFSSWPYQATNPKDKFFALQGLFKIFIMPDYEKLTSEIYAMSMSK